MGDSEHGGFEALGGACLGSIRALAMDDLYIYAGDEIGGVIQFDLASGEFLNLFFAPDSITAMVMHDGDLLISEVSGEIHRVDPVTWEELGTLISPIAVDAMLLAGVTCPWDLDGSGGVGINDFLALLAAWGPVPTPDPPDFDGDGFVGITDFLELLGHWGACP